MDSAKLAQVENIIGLFDPWYEALDLGVREWLLHENPIRAVAFQYSTTSTVRALAVHAPQLSITLLRCESTRLGNVPDAGYNNICGTINY